MCTGWINEQREIQVHLYSIWAVQEAPRFGDVKQTDLSIAAGEGKRSGRVQALSARAGQEHGPGQRNKTYRLIHSSPGRKTV